MRATTVSNDVVTPAIGPFTVQLTGEGICPVHFKNGQVCLGNYQLTAEQQRNFIELFSQAYRGVRRRNYGWRFLSSCHAYFNGQLEEIQALKTEEAKIRYLFCHAERMPTSKTAEAIQAILPAFYEQLICAQPVDVVAPYERKKTTHFMSEPAYQAVKKMPEKTLIVRSDSHVRYLQWMDEAFKSLWAFDSVKKTADVRYDIMYLKHDLSFYGDCRAAIMKSNLDVFAKYNSYDHTMEREIAEAEWAKKLYFSFDHFRWRLKKSNGYFNEIHHAFIELIEQIHVDPPNLDSAYLRNSDFHDAVINLRLQSIVIHIGWRESLSAGEAVCDLKH